MICKGHILIALILTACEQRPVVHTQAMGSAYLIEADALLARIGSTHMKLVDLRSSEDYTNGHIAGAVYVQRVDLEDASYAYEGMMANKEQIEQLLGKLGISSEDTLVLYDNNGLCEASRLWWILQNHDHRKVKMLHGGVAAWIAVGGQLSTERTTVEKAVFELPVNSSMRYAVSKEEMQKALATDVVILDARTDAEFSGAWQKPGSARAGRIPGSIHIDWAEAVNYDGDQRLRSVEELERIYERMGISKEDPVIVYCHSGVRSAHTTFVLTQLLGYTNVKNYDGSWTEWSHFKDLPIEVDVPTLLMQ